MRGLDLRDELDRLRAARSLPRALAVACCGAALYGAALGAWHGPRMAAWAALKLPLVLVLTGAATLAFNALAALVLGERLRPVEVARFTASALAVTGALLAALAPAATLFSLSVRAPGTAARLDHNLLYLLHVGVVGAAGLAGTAALWRSLAAACRSPRTARAVFCVWVGSLALVGGEVAWALRPFLGSVYHEVAFLRPDALDGNVYELVITDIVPYLTGREGGQEDSHE